jgi:hypothetical protein
MGRKAGTAQRFDSSNPCIQKIYAQIDIIQYIIPDADKPLIQ